MELEKKLIKRRTKSLSEHLGVQAKGRKLCVEAAAERFIYSSFEMLGKGETKITF